MKTKNKKFIKAVVFTFVFITLFMPFKIYADVKSTVTTELHINGETNFIVYRVPEDVMSNSQEKFKNEIIHFLSEISKIKSSRIENYHNGTKFTIFLEDFISTNNNQKITFQLDPQAITGPLESNQTFHFKLITNKLIDWKMNNQLINQLGFHKKLSLLSQQTYLHSGTVESFLSLPNQSYIGSLDMNQITMNSFIYYSLTIIVLFCGYMMSQQFKFHMLKHSDKKDKLRKISQRYQIPVLICIIIQFVFSITSGTLLIYEHLYGSLTGLLLSFFPLVVSALSVLLYFVLIQNKVITLLETKGDSYQSFKSSKELWSMFIPVVVPITMTIILNFVLYIFPWNLFDTDSRVLNLVFTHWVELIIISMAFLMAPSLHNLLLPKEPLMDEHIKQKINKLCSQHSVKFNRVYVIPSKKYRIANAMVSGYFNKNLYIYDYLFESLEDDELDAVILHEIGHVKKGHFFKIFGLIITILITFQVILYFFNDLGWYGVVLYFITLAFMITGVMRKFEFQADEFSANDMDDPQKMINALSQITKANYMDQNGSEFSTILQTHPSIKIRIRNLRKLSK